ncbi:hypothetical protein LZ30DRAFT_742718 [Colletotrichum cereale]|nr:hypothetical protein LZ30DRAFT_742718 [Colletotrichum cereale]
MPVPLPPSKQRRYAHSRRWFCRRPQTRPYGLYQNESVPPSFMSTAIPSVRPSQAYLAGAAVPFPALKKHVQWKGQGWRHPSSIANFCQVLVCESGHHGGALSFSHGNPLILPHNISTACVMTLDSSGPQNSPMMR